MLKIQKQIGYLYTSSILESLTLTGAWVAILSSRGFSLVEISMEETVFHLVSLLLELPSGILADVFGRKRMLIVSAADNRQCGDVSFRRSVHRLHLHGSGCCQL